MSVLQATSEHVVGLACKPGHLAKYSPSVLAAVLLAVNDKLLVQRTANIHNKHHCGKSKLYVAITLK